LPATSRETVIDGRQLERVGNGYKDAVIEKAGYKFARRLAAEAKTEPKWFFLQGVFVIEDMEKKWKELMRDQPGTPEERAAMNYASKDHTKGVYIFIVAKLILLECNPERFNPAGLVERIRWASEIGWWE
jgi:hypothetical protein